MSLFWRVYVTNAGLLALATVLLGLTPVTVSWPIALTEALVLLLGLAAMLVGNAALLRPTFAPLERLARYMRQVDLLRPGQAMPASGRGEVAGLIDAFNEMLLRLETERRASGRRAATAQETERKRIATELHDEVGQSMTAVLMLLDRCDDGLAAEQRDRVVEAREAVRESLEDVRRLAAELRPEMLEHLGLTSALTALSCGFAERTGIRVDRRIATGLPVLSGEAELAVYRIVQESLTNVARHSEASGVRLELAARRLGTEEAVEVRVVDDGRGFPAAATEHGGLRGMRERALTVGAELSYLTPESGGSEVLLRVPPAGVVT